MARFWMPVMLLGNNGQDGYDTQVNGAEEGQIVESTLANEVRRGLAGPEAGNESAVLLQVIGYLHGIKLDGGIEVAEAR